MNFNHFNSLKVYVLNLTTFGVTFTNTSEGFKMVLLIASIIFTVVKTIDVVRKWRKKDELNK